MNNQEKFNELSAEIFSQLYDSFPVGISINLSDYSTFDIKENSDIFYATIDFYINEKFIRCNDKFYGGFNGVVLTSKGFSVLNKKPPEQFSSESNIAAELKEAMNTGKKLIIKTLVSEVIKNGIQLIT